MTESVKDALPSEKSEVTIQNGWRVSESEGGPTPEGGMTFLS